MESAEQAIPDQIDPRTFFSRPDIYPLEFTSGHLDFVPMSPDTYRRSLFTDRGRIVPAAKQGWRIPIAEVLTEFQRAKPRRQPLFFIFHIAHCGSTLLARAVDIPGHTLVIREPFTLRQLAVEAVNPSDRGMWLRCLALTTTLLGRRFAPDEPAIIKANVPVNFMIRELMARNPESRGLLMYSNLDDYLLSVLKTPMHRRWVGNVFRQLLGAIESTSGMEGLNLSSLDAPRMAACLWAAQLRRYHEAMAECDRLRSLNGQVLFDRPAEVLQATLEFAGAAVSGAQVEKIVNGDLFQRHAKDPGRVYDSEARRKEMARLSESLAPELAAARDWVATLPGWEKVSAPVIRPLTG